MMGPSNWPPPSPSHGWRAGLWPYFLLTIPPLCWAGNAVVARGIAAIVPPVSLAFWRWAVAFAILFIFTRRQVKQDWKTVLHAWKWMLLLSFLGITCFNTLLYTAAHSTTAINIALMQITMPAMIILISLGLFRERISPIQMTGVMLSIGGAFLILLRGKWQTLLSMSFVTGDILMLVAVLCYAFYSVLLRKRPAIHPLSFLTITFGWGTAILLPLYIFELFTVGSFTISYVSILNILYIAVFPSIVAYFCWNRGIELIGANRAGLFINLIPVFASVLAIFLLDEVLYGYHIIGLGLVFAGMMIFNRVRKPLY